MIGKTLSVLSLCILPIFCGESQQTVANDVNVTADLVSNLDQWKEGTFTAYSVGDGYTPSTVMANGKEVHVGAVACPSRLKLGTEIIVERLGTLVCEDRKAKRFRDQDNFDVYMDSVEEARTHGVQSLSFRIK